MLTLVAFNKLLDKYKNKTGEDLLQHFITKEFSNEIALVSSFGIEAAVLLDMVARIDSKTPIIFLETGKHFTETLDYRDQLIKHFNLKNVKSYFPEYVDIQRLDSKGDLHETNPTSCCYIRKVKPLNTALNPYNAWITGRKRFHGGLRADLPMIELFDGKVKINPLANMTPEEIQNEFNSREIPRHPLQDKGYLSIGCAPCTSLSTNAENPRGGRWKDKDKTECGIHIGADGKFHRGTQ